MVTSAVRWLLALAIAVWCGLAAADPAPSAPVWTVHFSPHGGCADAIVELIGSAKESVHVAAYSFTSKPIADALIAAARAGRHVQLVLDRSDRTSATAARVRAAGAEVWIDARHPIMHDKFVIVDGRVVETGSYNYTQQAERGNAENCLIVRDVELARAYLENWQVHRRHAAAAE